MSQNQPQNKKLNFIAFILVIVIGLLAGFLIRCSTEPKKEKTVVVDKSKEHRTIDSLQKLFSESYNREQTLKFEIDSLKYRISLTPKQKQHVKEQIKTFTPTIFDHIHDSIMESNGYR